jgi:hypothetical protein
MSEMIHDARIARIGGKHRDDDVQAWMGDSIAHWDGDTLVVETRHIDPRSQGVFVSQDGVIRERFTRVSDSQILYEFEIDDPATYASVWRGQMTTGCTSSPATRAITACSTSSKAAAAPTAPAAPTPAARTAASSQRLSFAFSASNMARTTSPFDGSSASVSAFHRLRSVSKKSPP